MLITKSSRRADKDKIIILDKEDKTSNKNINNHKKGMRGINKPRRIIKANLFDMIKTKLLNKSNNRDMNRDNKSKLDLKMQLFSQNTNKLLINITKQPLKKCLNINLSIINNIRMLSYKNTIYRIMKQYNNLLNHMSKPSNNNNPLKFNQNMSRFTRTSKFMQITKIKLSLNQ